LLRNRETPKGYRYTLELVDDATRQVMARCDLTGRASGSRVSILDERERAWSMAPNRRFAPSRWIVTDPDQYIALQFDQKALQKLANPLYRTAVSLLDAAGGEICRVVDQRTSVAERIFDVGPAEWIVVDGDKPLAKLVRLPRLERRAPGLLGAVRAFLAGSDPGIVSLGGYHLLPAPATLALQILLDELTDTSGGPP
jgi:hypothetical protein